MSAPKERREDQHGAIVLMAQVDGYVMVRRPRCVPWVMNLEKWEQLPLTGDQ